MFLFVVCVFRLYVIAIPQTCNNLTLFLTIVDAVVFVMVCLKNVDVPVR